jgi:pimeloyl-ACP methyl ester carboxylesterase
VRLVEQPPVEVRGVPVFWRSAGGGETPVVYVHGVPGSSDDWLALLEVAGGIALDLPGFGRSGKPAAFDYSIGGIGDVVEQFLDRIGLDRVTLVLHAWGAAALSFAQRRPERVSRLVVVNGIPLFDGYRWHSVARWWRRPVIGETMMLATSRKLLGARLRAANPSLPPEFLERLTAHCDRGTKRAILRLYRSAGRAELRSAGRSLSELRMPVLVVWGDRDPYAGPEFADAYAGALPGAELLHVPDAGHWPWVDRPDLIDRITSFASERDAAAA